MGIEGGAKPESREETITGKFIRLAKEVAERGSEIMNGTKPGAPRHIFFFHDGPEVITVIYDTKAEGDQAMLTVRVSKFINEEKQLGQDTIYKITSDGIVERFMRADSLADLPAWEKLMGKVSGNDRATIERATQIYATTQVSRDEQEYKHQQEMGVTGVDEAELEPYLEVFKYALLRIAKRKKFSQDIKDGKYNT